MSFFAAILYAFLLFFLIGLAQVLWHLFRGYRTVKKMMNGQMNDEDLQRMWGKKTGGRQTYQQQRTTQTADGVTIIDQRGPEETNKKIFAPDEGEYVEDTEKNEE